MKYKIDFISFGEVRMGSPYNVVSQYKIEGDYVPDLKDVGLQNLSATNEDGSVLYISSWGDTKVPNFRIIKIDANNKETRFSKTINGCCEKLYLKEGKVFVDKFLYDKEKPKEEQFIKEIPVDEFPIVMEG